METTTSASHNQDFEIGIICALPLEAQAARAIFDTIYNEEDRVNRYGKAEGDTNCYTTGKIGHHDAVLAHMPGMGKVSAAGVSSSFKSTFGGLKLVLLVGICGGVPNGPGNTEIVLGDIIIGKNVSQADFGRQYPGGFIKKDGVEDSLGRQGPQIRSFIAKMESSKRHLEETTSKHLVTLLGKPELQHVRYPGANEDKLFVPDYLHKHHNSQDCGCVEDGHICSTAKGCSCEQLDCQPEYLVARNRLRSEQGETPIIHFGSVASSDSVIKSGRHRDMIAKAVNAIAFEMEGAGVWDYLPCIIVKGVCDYADSHKNKKWQGYAAAAASACAKSILERWDVAVKLCPEAQQYRVKNQWNTSGNAKVMSQAENVSFTGNSTFNF